MSPTPIQAQVKEGDYVFFNEFYEDITEKLKVVKVEKNTNRYTFVEVSSGRTHEMTGDQNCIRVKTSEIEYP